MKPKNKFQKQVFELSKTLAPINKVQKKWAFQHCFEHIGIRNAKGLITCLDCGHRWKGNSELGDVLRLSLKQAASFNFLSSASMCIVIIILCIRFFGE